MTEVGAALREFTYRGRPLVRGFTEDEIMPAYSGAVLAPWPNRLADGSYRHAGEEFRVALNEPERGTALHGLVTWLPWVSVSRGPAEARLECTLWPTPGYPFPLRLTMVYRLSETGLGISLSAENLGSESAPYGCSIHPYLLGGSGAVDDWLLELPTGTVLDVDAERLLPVDERSVAGTSFDFRSAQRLGAVRIDNAFGDVAFDAEGTAAAKVWDTDGRGVRLVWDRTCPWVQVCTADHARPELDRTGLAVEPMTCPPNAFRSGRDLIHLAAGATHTADWHLSAL